MILNLRSELKILLQAAALIHSQVIETKACQRIGRKPLSFDGLMPFPANPERALLDPSQRRTALLEQADEPRCSRRPVNARDEPFTPILQQRPKIHVLNGGGHGEMLRMEM